MCLIGGGKAVRVGVSLIVLCRLAGLVVLLFFRSHVAWIAPHFETVADAVATGCLLAGLSAWLNGRRAYLQFLASKWFIMVPCTFMAVQLVFPNSIRYLILFYILLGIIIL